MNREAFEHHVVTIMKTFRPDTSSGEGGTADYVNYVLENNGTLKQFSDEMARISLEETVKRLIRSGRLPEHGNIREFASVNVVTGTDEEGNPVEKRVYIPTERVLFDKEDYLVDQVVDYHIGRATYHQRESNRWVTQRRIATNGSYQRQLPFPELEDSRR